MSTTQTQPGRDGRQHEHQHEHEHDTTSTSEHHRGHHFGRRGERRPDWRMGEGDDLDDGRQSRRRGPRGRGGQGAGRGFGPGVRPGFGPGLRPAALVASAPAGRGERGRGRRGGRGGRGDVRAAILTLLAEQPMHGYQLIQQITERSGGVWTPSPGSVYPALSQLEDEGLVTFERVDGRKTASLTDAGRAARRGARGRAGLAVGRRQRRREQPGP